MASARGASRRVLELYENVPVGLCEVDAKGRVVMMNQTLLGWLGYSQVEVIDRIPFKALVSESATAQLDDLQERVQRGETVKAVDLELLSKHGSHRLPVRVSATPVYGPRKRFGGWRASVRDVTWDEEVQQQLLRVRTLEAIMQLVRGIAHELNNPLQVIIGYAELAQERLGSNHPLSNAFNSIETAAFRAATLVQRLQAFSSHQPLQKVTINLNELILKLSNSLRNLMPQHVELFIATRAEKAMIFADPTSLRTMVMNLVENARDALAAGGKVYLETGNVTLGAEDLQKHVAGKQGDYVCLTASDTGVGMDSATLTRIFEPFFTTKQMQTGLGLSVVWGIVQQHEGYIDVSSEPGAGTMVRIYLPCVPT